MDVREIDATKRQEREAFIGVPFRIYGDVPQWVPPLRADVRHMLDRRKHPYYEHSDAAFFLAWEGNRRPLGRIAVLENRAFNDFHERKTAFFCLFECEEDPAAALALFETAFAWARRRGLKQIFGPKGLSPLDGLGVLTKGFEHRPAFGIPYNRDYYPAYLEAAGFQVADEIHSGYMPASAPFPDFLHELSRQTLEKEGWHVPRFRTRKELRMLVPMFRAMYNESLGSSHDGVPLSEAEASEIANALIRFADPRLIKVIMNGDEPVGFGMCYPDVSEALQRCGGRLFPLGWWRIMRQFRRTKWMNANGAGVMRKYRGRGAMPIFISEFHKSMTEMQFEHVDFVQVGKSNDKMLRALGDLGIDFYKTHCMYSRDL